MLYLTFADLHGGDVTDGWSYTTVSDGVYYKSHDTTKAFNVLTSSIILNNATETISSILKCSTFYFYHTIYSRTDTLRYAAKSMQRLKAKIA